MVPTSASRRTLCAITIYSNGRYKMKNKRVFVFLLVITILLSCKSNPSMKKEIPIKEYYWDHISTTGICIRIIKDGEIIDIKYHEKSNQEKLKLFYALRWFIHDASSSPDNKSRVIVVGKLHDEIKTTPSGKGFPKPENYREFEIIDWYLKRPFRQIAYDGKRPKYYNFDSENVEIIERYYLTIDDFKYFDGIESYDLEKYVRD
jgi:hypothetical protein